MKNIIKKLVKNTAKHSFDNSLNSTTCVNIYQPKIPKNLKKTKKQ